MFVESAQAAGEQPAAQPALHSAASSPTEVPEQAARLAPEQEGSAIPFYRYEDLRPEDVLFAFEQRGCFGLRFNRIRLQTIISDSEMLISISKTNVLVC